MPAIARVRLVVLSVCTCVLPDAIAPVCAQSAQQSAVQVTATVAASPPAISFTWPADATATGYTVARRAAGATAWGGLVTIPGGGTATSWTDTNVAVGARYEYWFRKTGNPAARGFLTAGIEADPIEDRGHLVLLVDATQAAALGARLDRLVQDLVGDGWTVLRHDVSPTEPVPAVKARIAAEAAAHPGQVRAVFLLGRIPVPYSGWIAPDGHNDHAGAWAADVYYGELDGPWTDTTVNTTTASRPQNRNVPGDGKFDQSSIPSDVDLAVGRVDFANMPAFAVGETALLQQYLDKDHDYRHRVFAVDQRAVIDDNFGWFSGEAFAGSGWRNFTALVGPANIVSADYFTTLNTAGGNGYVWSYGCGGGSYTSAGGIGSTASFAQSQNRNVFTMLFGSYFGDWDSTDNFLRAPLCSGWTLANAWAGRPHWSFHPMALGETLGYSTRLSQNDTTAGGYGGRWIHIALMGDPTLRQHVIAPPGSVAVADLWPQAVVSWTPSADPVAGYHVYRAPTPRGPFTRLTAAAVAGTNWTDPAPLQGYATYMVRALRLQTTPAGSYWNLSQGAFATECLPSQAAAHTSYGQGCYLLSDSFYQWFATPAAAAAALAGRAITLAPASGGYTVSAGGTWLDPTGAAALPLGDDDQVAIAPSAPFPHPGGLAATLHVHSNGIVALAPLAMAPAVSAVPDVATLLNEAAGAFYSWHDFDPTEPGSGSVRWHEHNGTVCVTWDGVESRPAGLANPGWLQFQFELATGVVRIVWQTLATAGTGQTTAPAEQHLVGWSPGGPSLDAGPIDLAAGLPWSVGATNREPLRLSASPAPISTATTGTVVTFTIDHVPELTPGTRLGFTIHSLLPDLTGTPLGPLFGMPGCTGYLGAFDVTLLFFGASPSLVTTLAVPPGLPCGLRVYSTALALFPPHSLPNALNALGGLASNGVASLVSDR